MVELGPKNLKLQTWRDFLCKRGDLTEEDQKMMDEKILKCHENKEIRKRKAEEDINDSFTKIAKMDIPPLFMDNLMEILCRFDIHELLIVSRVNKQFCSVARKILFSREIEVAKSALYNMKPILMPFVMKLRKMKINNKAYPSAEDCAAYNHIISQLTNLQSLSFEHDGDFIAKAVENLTQLQSMECSITSRIVHQTGRILTMPKLENFIELKELALHSYAARILNEELPKFLPVMTQLTSLKLDRVDIKSISTFETLDFFWIAFPTNQNFITLTGNFINIEHLDTSMRQEYGKTTTLVLNDAFELPHLTSLRTQAVETDFTKFTQLKKLTVGTAHCDTLTILEFSNSAYF